MGLEAAAENGKSELLAGDPIPKAPSKNPDVSSLMTPDSAVLRFTFAWMAILALTASFF